MPSLQVKKRSRQDGHLTRDTYDFVDAESIGKFSSGGHFNRAQTPTLNQRRIVVTRTQEYDRHISVLNASFFASIQDHCTHDSDREWTDNMLEYLAHARFIEERFGEVKGSVLTFGSGDCGQLAHGVERDGDMIVKFPRQVKGLNAHHVTRLACGGIHSAALTSVGQVFTWGCNDDGALGRAGDENLPALVQGFPTGTIVNQIVAGDCHTAASTVCGTVFTWGSYKDKDGKIWCDAENASSCFKAKQESPFRIKGLSDIVDLKCGDAFNLAKSADGSTYSWGLGEMGQLGRPVLQKIKNEDTGSYALERVFAEHLTPAQMQLDGKPLPPTRAIGCGGYHSLVSLSSTGDVYTCGLNNYGQLGLANVINSNSLLLVETLVPHTIVQVDGGSHNSLVLTSHGEMFAFGRGDSGQLGTVDSAETGYYRDVPQAISLQTTDHITMISSGSNHSLALSDSNSIYSWGYGDMLALGHGKEKDENKPRQLDWSKTSFGTAKILQVEAGGQHSAVLAVSKGSLH